MVWNQKLSFSSNKRSLFSTSDDPVLLGSQLDNDLEKIRHRNEK